MTERTLVLEGKLVRFDDKTAELEHLTGHVRVPASAVKRFKYQAGQNVIVYVDIADFLELNRELLARNKILPEKPKN